MVAVEVTKEGPRWWPRRGGGAGCGGGQEGWRCWPWWQQKWLKRGEGGGGHGGRTGHGGRRCSGCGSRPDPAVPGAISPLPRGLVPVRWVGSLSAESEGHWG